MDYRQILQLLSQRGNEVSGIHLGLHRIAAVMRALGNPHDKYASLHIAGTNGKGSVAAMSESILRAGGWKTGLYTSPHLETLEERIRLNGANIPARRLAEVATLVFGKEDELFARKELDMRLTYFEFMTACAFLYFAEEHIDVAVVEVGLGGRLDATNIVRPQASVITGISFDHQELLGSTLAQIAAEKAGIIKEGVPVISACRPLEARRVIRARARQTGSALMEIDRRCRIHVISERGAAVTIDLVTPRRSYRHLSLALAGLHQARNAALAIAAVETLESLPVLQADVRRGIATTLWPGRMDEYAAPRRTLFEGAHNEEGARALRNHLLRCEDCEMHLVFGTLRDKDFKKMGKLLFPLARKIHLTPVANSRSAATADIAAAHPRLSRRVLIHRDARTALRAAWEACPRRGLVVVTGSLYLVGELLPLARACQASVQNKSRQ